MCLYIGVQDWVAFGKARLHCIISSTFGHGNRAPREKRSRPRVLWRDWINRGLLIGAIGVWKSSSSSIDERISELGVLTEADS